MKTTIGQLLVNDALPEDLRDYTRTMDAKAVKDVLRLVADKYPDEYKNIVKRLSDIGKDVSYYEGSSFSLDMLKPAKAKMAVIPALQRRVDEIVNDPKMTREEKDKLIVEETSKLVGKLDEAVHQEGLADGNILSSYIAAGARGGKSQINQMRGSPLLVLDHHGKPVPIPMLRSFAEGIDPVEMWANSYGVRSGFVDVKLCLAEGTKVLMANGAEKAIEQIRTGDYVIGSDRAGKAKVVKVLDAFNNGERPCVEVVFRKNRTDEFISVVATEDHKFLAKYKNRISRNLIDIGGYSAVALPLRKAATRKEATDNPYVAMPVSSFEDFSCEPVPYALMLGLMLGDGCTRSRTYQFSCGDPLLIEDIAEYLKSVDIGLTPPKPGRFNYTVRYDSYRVDRHGKKGRHPFVEFCKRVGADWKYAWEKTLPKEIWSWPNARIAEVIAGVFSTDGCVHESEGGNVAIRLAITSYELVYQIKRLLELRLGVSVGPVQTLDQTDREWGGRTQYSCTVSMLPSVVKFSQVIPLVGLKKRTLASALVGKTTTFRNCECTYKSVSKRSAGMRRTYDLHVDHPDHMFVLANGLITSNSTPKAGYFGKQLANAAHKLVVTSAKPLEGTGLPVKTDDPDNDGAVLARDYGPYRAGTIITPRIRKDLQDKHEKIIIHSPISSIASGGGVAQWAVGQRERFGLARAGENVGISAAQAINEPLAQAAISSRHLAGIVGASGGGSSAALHSGFDTVNEMANIPKEFENQAPVSDIDGSVGTIEPAPQGGSYVHISGTRHYVPAHQQVIVKPGQAIEAGDILSDGIPNPSNIVRYKGIGEGRRYFMEELNNVLKNSGAKVSRRNVELLTRGLINHVRMTGEAHGKLPDDIVEYDDFASKYSPRAGSYESKPNLAKNRYLEAPVLHYSIGTRLTPRTIDTLKEHSVDKVMVHDDAPEFEPEMQRAMDIMNIDPDWKTRLGGFYLQKNFLDAVHRGAKSEDHSMSYVPSLAKGVEFGKSKVPGQY